MTPRHPQWTWRKASYSGSATNCVEIGYDPAGRQVGVRDSKNATGPVITGPNLQMMLRMIAAQ